MTTPTPREAAPTGDALPCDITLEEQGQLVLLQQSGLFDGAWFVTRNFDFADASHAALLHWFRFGWREHRWPNAYFDPEFYRANHPGTGDGNPLLHYIEHGEAAGHRPVPYFDPAWYRQQHIIPPAELALTHFLRHRFDGTVSPIPEFDSAHYLAVNGDVAAAGMDPLEHYLLSGFREGRLPSPGFELRRHQRDQHHPDYHPNPLLDLLRRQRAGTADILALPSIAQEVRRTTAPHACCEPVAALPAGTVLQAKLLAYYLPQYYPVAENDLFWGRGFTEWTNLQRALPRFAGHYQPRIPRDLGHYRLDQAGTLRRQIELARGAGLHGFVFYHYWFNGRRLLRNSVCLQRYKRATKCRSFGSAKARASIGLQSGRTGHVPTIRHRYSFAGERLATITTSPGLTWHAMRRKAHGVRGIAGTATATKLRAWWGWR